MSEQYNGWKNYETYLVDLNLNNDEGSYNALRTLVKSYRDIGVLSREIKDLVINAMPTDLDCIYQDLLNAAVNRIDWYALAKGAQEMEFRLNDETEE